MVRLITDVKNDLCHRKEMGESDCQEGQEVNEITVGSH